MSYALFDNAGHLLSRIDDRLVLWDTGAPASVGRGDVDCFSVAGHTVELTQRYYGVDVHDIGQAIPAEDEPIAFDVLAGMDVLGVEPVAMDLQAGTITFGADAPTDPAVDLRLASNLGIPLLPIRLEDGEPRQALFDTGACVSYLHSSLWRDGPDVETGWDYFPGYGRFAVRKRPHAVRLGEETLQIRAATLPEELERGMLGSERGLILGSEVLQEFRLYLDMPRERFALTRS